MAATYESTAEAVAAERGSLWDRSLATMIQWDWDRILLVALLVVAVITRFWDLGARAYNHDESIHTHYSFDLYQGRGYIHNPIYHGPLLYHITALIFFLFGDTDVTGRVPNVLMGFIILAMPFFFRKWLGKRGWFITAFLLLISPSVTYYSRFNRHDVYVEVFVLLMLLTVLKYFETRRGAWLYGAAAALALSFTAMETTFIFLALYGYGLVTLFTWQWLRANRGVRWSEPVKGLAAVFLSMPFFAGYMAYYVFRGLLNRGEYGESEIDPRTLPAFDLAVLWGSLSLPMTVTPLILKLAKIDPAGFPVGGTLQNALPYLGALIAVFALAAVVGLVWDAKKWVLSAVIFYPLMLLFFTTVFTNFAGVGTGLIGSLGYWLSQQDVARGGQPWYYYILVTMPLYEYLPYLFGIVGMLWIMARTTGARMVAPVVWLLVVFGFWLFFAPAFTSADAPKPLPTDLFTSITLGLVLLTIPLVAYAAYDPDRPETQFHLLLFVWTLGVMIFFSWAGEKMPWLTMHFAIPLSFITGLFMDGVLKANWRTLYERGVLLFGLLFTVGFFVLAMQIFFGPASLSGMSIDQTNQTFTTVFAVIVIGAIAGVLYLIGTRLGLMHTLRVAVVTGFIILAGFTIHSMVLAAYINSDVAVETLIYAQGSPDDPIAMREIDDLSRRLCAQNPTDGKRTFNCDNGTIKVAYDDESSWPFVWYLRNYRNQQYFGKTPGAPFDAEVVIVGPTNEAGVKAFLGNRYTRRQMRLIWWPIEGYKDLTWDRINGFLKPDAIKSLVRDVWFFHHYSESLSNWPYVHTFAFYVRKDIATSLWNYGATVNPGGTTQADDEYVKKFQSNVRARSSVGVPGNGQGQLNSPRSVTLDAQGNLYVSDSGNFRVLKFDSSGKYLAQFGIGQGSGAGQFADGPGGNPWGLAVDKQGNLYVADTWNHRIQKYDPAGKLITQWGVFGQALSPTESLNLLYGPRAIAIGSDGNLWVTDTGNKRVVEYDPNGRPLAAFGGAGADPGQFLEPVGITTDAQGNFYVADTWNARIQKFDKTFAPVAQWPLEAWDSQSVLNKPFIAVDPDGSVYVTDPDNYRVIKVGSDGKLLAVFGARGSDTGGFETPTGIAVGPDGSVYVADSGNSRILIFDPLK